MRGVLILLIGCLLTGGPAQADSASTSYIVAVAQDSDVAITWSLALRDLHEAIGLDRHGDGKLTWGEVRAQTEQIAAYALPRLRLAASGAVCTPGPVQLLVDDFAGTAYAVLRFSARCPLPVTQLEIAYSALFDIDPRHRGLLNLAIGGASAAGVFSPERRSLQFGTETSRMMLPVEFLRAGVAHLLGGADHLLFILMLVLPALLRRDVTAGTGARLIDVIRLLTAFTVAHACTLTLAVLRIATVSPRIAEPAIALTILITALDNIRPFLPDRRLMLAFGFGLVHGMSVASGLGPLLLAPASLVVALLSFNVGIETAQLLVAASFAPIAYCLRRTPPASHRVLPTLSAAAALIAAGWLT